MRLSTFSALRRDLEQGENVQYCPEDLQGRFGKFWKTPRPFRSVAFKEHLKNGKIVSGAYLHIETFIRKLAPRKLQRL